MSELARCPECGDTFSTRSGGHCRGGRYGGCCRTFSSDSAFDAHRMGSFTARRCIPVDGIDLWRLTNRGWTNSPPLDSDALERITGGVG